VVHNYLHLLAASLVYSGHFQFRHYETLLCLDPNCSGYSAVSRKISGEDVFSQLVKTDRMLLADEERVVLSETPADFRGNQKCAEDKERDDYEVFVGQLVQELVQGLFFNPGSAPREKVC
jgi:hypothetical protein